MKEKLHKISISENIKEDCVLFSVSISYLYPTFKIVDANLNHFDYGIIHIVNGKKTIHSWENEEQAQKDSYLLRRFTVVLLNGINTNESFEKKFIENLKKKISLGNYDKKKKEMINVLLDKVEKYK